MNTNLDEFLNESKVWNEIHTLAPLDFFKIATLDNLTVMQSLKYGDRIMYHKILGLDDEKLAELILINFKDKWNNLIEYATADINLGMSGNRSLTETIKNGETRTSSQDTANKVSAFNSDDLITNDGSHTGGTQTLDGDKVRIVIDGEMSLNNIINNLSLLDQTNIINVVMKDVTDFITLSIY